MIFLNTRLFLPKNMLLLRLKKIKRKRIYVCLIRKKVIPFNLFQRVIQNFCSARYEINDLFNFLIETVINFTNRQILEKQKHTNIFIKKKKQFCHIK